MQKIVERLENWGRWARDPSNVQSGMGIGTEQLPMPTPWDAALDAQKIDQATRKLDPLEREFLILEFVKRKPVRKVLVYIPRYRRGMWIKEIYQKIEKYAAK